MIDLFYLKKDRERGEKEGETSCNTRGVGFLPDIEEAVINSYT